MSKSRGNVVGALDMAAKYGCDTGRVYTLFAAPPEKDMEWSDESIEGCWRFLQRVYRLVTRHAERLRGVAAGQGPRKSTSSGKEKALLRKAHQTLKRISFDLEERWHYWQAFAHDRNPVRQAIAERASTRYGLLLHDLTESS